MIYIVGSTPHKDAKQIKIIKIVLKELNIDCSKYEALVLTSKNAVASLEKSKISWQHLPCYVIGKGTKEAVLNAGGKIAHMAKEAYGETLAKEVAPLLKGKKTLLVRPKEVVTDVSGYLKKHGVLVDDFVGYETCCNFNENTTLPKDGSILIFTSPSAVECFFKNIKWNESWRVISIGRKTAQVLPKNVPHLMPKYQSVDECVKLAFKINENLSKDIL